MQEDASSPSPKFLWFGVNPVCDLNHSAVRCDEFLCVTHTVFIAIISYFVMNSVWQWSYTEICWYMSLL